ncbi:MAG: winged helix-turn-helix domain-containing protein [Candidatus ainarchaeum sp.]|nr:winged helix-turn-helix domain-containing protein [Candidatus ainarchaeum sp.]MDD3976307.1 winged helix-turn-helix domain-containing protein [Candidatus ainarchaeum sp.]
MDNEKILINRKTLKAIASDTRMNILKALGNRKYTLSELSSKLSLSNATVKEHLDVLVNSDLIKKNENDYKWKYYSLTEKGKKLINPKEVKILISFMVSFLATIGFLITIFSRNTNLAVRSTKNMAMKVGTYSSEVVNDIVTESSQAMSSNAIDGINQIATVSIPSTISNIPLFLIIMSILFGIITIFLLGIYIQEKRSKKKIKIQVID